MLPRWIPALVIAWMSGAAVAADEPASVAKVTYVTTSSVYVDAGTAEGLRAGHRLEVVRDGQVVAVLELKDVTTHRASCSVVERTSDPVVGDAVRFVPVPESPVPPPDTGSSEVPPGFESSRAPSRDLGIHGLIGMSYLAISDRASGTGYSQPALLLQVNGSAIAGSPWYLAADLRARRTTRDLSDGTSAENDATRVYRLALSRRGREDPWAVTIGRQYAPTLAAVSIFDGVSVEYVRPRWGAGLFGGTQPDPEDFGYSEQVTDYGVYASFRGLPNPRHGWQLSTAVIGSYDDGELNREYLYLQGNYAGPVFSIYAAEEVDFNRGWKKDEGADSVELTGSFVTTRFQAGRKVALLAGFDNRKNVRLWRDHETPITEFDDAFREGVWAGLFVQPAPRLSFGLDGRTNGGGSAGDSSSYSVSFGANGYTRHSLGFNTRVTDYATDRVEGQLYALDFGLSLSSRVHALLGGGQRDENGASGVSSNLTWYGVDLDLTLGRHWYLLIAGERTDGDFEQDQQLYTALSYQF